MEAGHVAVARWPAHSRFLRAHELCSEVASTGGKGKKSSTWKSLSRRSVRVTRASIKKRSPSSWAFRQWPTVKGSASNQRLSPLRRAQMRRSEADRGAYLCDERRR
jgi:hypothetical protein